MIATYGELHLHTMTDYELRTSQRYRRFFSLVFMASDNCGLKFWNLIGDLLRNSDEFVELDGYASILMSETDKHAALQAVNRFLERQEGDADICYSIASFPNDGKTSLELLQKASDRLAKARNSDEGAIVYDE